MMGKADFIKRKLVGTIVYIERSERVYRQNTGQLQFHVQTQKQASMFKLKNRLENQKHRSSLRIEIRKYYTKDIPPKADHQLTFSLAFNQS